MDNSLFQLSMANRLIKAVLICSATLFLTLSSSATAADGNSGALVATVAGVADKLEARVGFAAYDLQTGQRWEYQADQRFPMSSTFKTLACAALLHRVDAGAENLDREVGFSEADLVTYSPVTEIFAGRQAMTLSGLCEAALTTSDNTAANLVLQVIGGPEALTAFVKTTLKDKVTRLDRWETELNDAVPGDPRDTTTPKAMVKNLDKLLFGEVLSTKSKEQLRDWLVRNQVSDELFRASIPQDWVIADRTGAGGFGSRSITALIWPPERQPIIVALYITETEASFTERNAAIALIGATIVAEVKP